MKWQKLTLNNIDKLRISDKWFLVATRTEHNLDMEWPFDIVQYVNLGEFKDNNHPEECWHSILNDCYHCNHYWEPEAEELCKIYNYFCPLDQPERSKRKDLSNEDAVL